MFTYESNTKYVYGGDCYDSIAEATWAEYFDLAGMPAVKEPETFEFPARVIYTPDFWLPEQDCFVEIKRGNRDDVAVAKIEALVRNTGKYALLLDGKPSQACMFAFGPTPNPGARMSRNHPDAPNAYFFNQSGMGYGHSKIIGTRDAHWEYMNKAGLSVTEVDKNSEIAIAEDNAHYEKYQNRTIFTD